MTMAVKNTPRCRKPVGLGAIRVTRAPSGRERGGYSASYSSGVLSGPGKRASASFSSAVMDIMPFRVVLAGMDAILVHFTVTA